MSSHKSEWRQQYILIDNSYIFLVLFSAWIYRFFQELGDLNVFLINSFYNDQYI